MAQRITQDGATRLTDGADVRVTEDDAGGPERVSGREPLQLVEVHQDFCSWTYGSAPCRAILPFDPYVFDVTGGSLPEGAALTRGPGSDPGWSIGSDGLLQQSIEDGPRFTHVRESGSWVLGGLLVESSAANALTDPRDLTTAAWFSNATVARDATGFDGAANAACTLTDPSTTSRRLAGQSVAIADDAATHTAVILVRKDADETRFPRFDLACQNGTLVRTLGWLNTKTGAVVEQSSSGMITVADEGDRWRVQLRVINNASGNTNLQLLISPAAGRVIGAIDLTAVGSIIVDFCRVEIGNQTVGSDLVGDREADLLVLDVPDGAYDVVIERVQGATAHSAVPVTGGGYAVPTSPSPLRRVSLVPLSARADTTGNRKCYNTRATCQDPENYDPEDLALMFARPMAVLPKGLLAIPSVDAIETAPTRLNIGAGSKNAGPFGSRAVATVTFRDHPSPDRLVDKYRGDRGFDPLTRGTFWTKWLARNPYYQNRRLVIRDGYVGQSLEEMVRRDYLLDRIEGPSPDGLVRVVAKDALKLAEDERAQAPRLSEGELTTAIDAAMMVFSVAPATEQDYPESGTLRIGRELMTYADRSEADGIVTFSGVVRGVEGTAADSHDAEERAQLCLRYDAMAVQEVLYDLLMGFGNVPAAFIDPVAWDQEAERWLQGFDLTALITEPTGVSSLVAEIVEQVPALIWWDERARLIKLRADRRDESAPPVIDERDHIVAGSVSVREDPTQRISQVWVYWRQRDPTQSESSEANFSRIRILADLEAEGVDLYGESRIRKVYARWLSTDAQATVLARRLLQRFGRNPRFLTVSLDAKDRALWTADFVQAATRLVTDDTGAEVTDLYQVVSAEETVSGHTVVYDLQRAAFASGVLAGFYMADEAPNHDAASDEQKAHGAWFAAEDGTLGDGSAGYVWQ